MEMVFKIWKITAMACGGLVGWMIGEFKPAFLWPSWPSCLWIFSAFSSFSF